MHRLTKPLILGSFIACWLGCSTPAEQLAATSAPLYVDAYGGGHGPFACAGAVPGRGYVDLYTGNNYTGTCYRWRGDFADDSGGAHLGYVIWPYDWVGSIKVSPWVNSDLTWFDYCEGNPQLLGNCDPHYRSTGGMHTDLPVTGWAYGPIVVKYGSACPAQTSPLTHFHQCAGAYTPEDDSGYATAVISDGIVSPGLPYGHPLFEPNSNSLATDCLADLVAYGADPLHGSNLVSQFTPPSGYIRGTRVAAVYYCP